jgi:hypothetical protein
MQMLPIYHEPHFTFRFGDDRIIPRFHLQSARPGQPVSVFKLDTTTGERLELLSTAVVGEGGWVDLPSPLRVKAGDAFIAICGETHGAKQ